MDLKTVAAQLVELYNNLNQKQKIVIVVTLFVVIAFISFIVVVTGKKASQDEYGVLFEKLQPADSALIIEQLQLSKTPYNIPRDGVITVPQDIVYEERIKMASLGIPKSSNVGFELFDTKEFGATEFDQEIKFLRALEGELSRTVESLNQVDQAVVKLALPKESVFARQRVEPTASVVVRMNEQYRITNKQVQGIKNLVASAVSRLIPENVKVINEYGETVGDIDEFAQAGETARMQLRYKKDYEKSLEDKIISALAPIVGGRDRVVANVDVDFDFSQRDSQEEVFDPDSVIRSEQVMEESREGMAPEPIGGVPGAVGNIGPVEGLENDRQGEKYEQSQTTTNFEISKRVSNIRGAFATVQRVTAAVVVDGTYNTNEQGVVEYQARADEQLAQMQRVVEQSIGIEPNRGDGVVVSNFQFKETAAMMEVDPMQARISQVEYYLEPFKPFLKYLFAFLVLFIFYKKVISPYAEKMLEIKEKEQDSVRPSLMIEEEEDDDLNEKYGSMRKKVEEQLGMAWGDFNEEAMRYEILLEKLREASEENPEDIANLLTLLIRDETEMERSAMQS